jgi:hypothetical protein
MAFESLPDWVLLTAYSPPTEKWMSESVDPAPPADLQTAFALRDAENLMARWNPVDALDRHAATSLEQATEYLRLKDVSGLPWKPSKRPDFPNWPPLKTWVIDPPVKIPKGSAVSFIRTHSEREDGSKFDFIQTCVADLEFVTPSDGTFRHSVALTSPKTAGVPSLRTLRVYVEEYSSGDENEWAVEKRSVLVKEDRPRFHWETLQQFDHLLDDADEVSLGLLRPDDADVRTEDGSPLTPEQISDYTHWQREQIRDLVERAYEAGRAVREAELRARFELWATEDKARRSKAGKDNSEKARVRSKHRDEIILEMALAYREACDSEPSNELIYKYIRNKKPFAPPTKGTQDKIKLAGMPSRLYFEKIMQRIRKDPRWHMGQAPAKTPE